MKSRPTGEKRRKERARQERKKEKAEKRDMRKNERADRPDGGDAEVDPDIAGIVPGPQPLPDEFWGGEDAPDLALVIGEKPADTEEGDEKRR